MEQDKKIDLQATSSQSVVHHSLGGAGDSKHQFLGPAISNAAVGGSPRIHTCYIKLPGCLTYSQARSYSPRQTLNKTTQKTSSKCITFVAAQMIMVSNCSTWAKPPCQGGSKHHR